MISVVIPCRNEKRHISTFLDSLLQQELEPGWNLEIIVADGMSDDGTRAVLDDYARESEHVRVIDNPGRIVSTALNAAIAAARGDIVIRMDAHTWYAPDYIRECVRALRQSGADNVGGPWIARGQGVVGEAIAAAFHSRFCVGGGKAHDPAYEGEIDTVYLGCWAKAAFERFGGFDSTLVRNQDDEFNFRMRRLGGRIWQSPRIRSEYVPRGSLRALFRQYFQYGFWRVAVIRKYRALASWRHAVPALFVGGILCSLLAAGIAALFNTATASSIAAMATAVVLIYGFACVIAAVALAGSVHRRALLLVPIVISVYHVAYGLGTLFGLAHLAVNFGQSHAPEHPLFTALTR